MYETEAKVQLATHQDIDQAIDAAVKAQPAMGALGSYERKTILLQVPCLLPASQLPLEPSSEGNSHNCARFWGSYAISHESWMVLYELVVLVLLRRGSKHFQLLPQV